MESMQVHLFAALVRMRTFYGKLYPAYDAANVSSDYYYYQNLDFLPSITL